MNKRQFEVEKAKLEDEEDVLSQLKSQYDTALKDINNNVKSLQQDIDDLSTELQVAIDNGDTAKALIIKSRIQAKVYRRGYQQALKGQIDGIVDRMNKNQYSTIQSYLRGCYDSGFVGAMYDIAGQGIPLILGINQKALTKAITLDSKVSQKLYGSNIALLKKRIQGEISRGIATGANYIDIARNLKNQTQITLNNAMRIVRTEGHRIQQVSGDDARHQAKAKGADVLKQWDATMDKKTRASHARVDGEIRELDEPFSNGLMFPGDPNGSAAEVINCRCTALQRSKWGLDEDELETLKKRAEYFGLDKAENFKDFQEKYLKNVENTEKKNIIKNITLDDFNSIKGALAEKFGKNITVREDVLDCIYGVLKGAKGLNLYEDIQVKPLGNKIIFQTDSVQHGTWAKNSFIINREAIQGKTVKEIDQRIKDAQNTVCGSLEDAIYHEYMHAKTSQVISFAKYEQLCESKGYPEISKEAAQDLAETIAEIGVLKKQGRYDLVSDRGKKLFEEIIGDSYD